MKIRGLSLLSFQVNTDPPVLYLSGIGFDVDAGQKSHGLLQVPVDAESSRHGLALRVKAVNARGVGSEVDHVAVADAHFTAGPDINVAEGAGIDVDEGVGTEVLGDADLALPSPVSRTGRD